MFNTNFGKSLKRNFLRHFAPHRADLLDNPLRRRFTAPDAMPAHLMGLLLSDRAFTKKLKGVSGESLIQVAIVGNEVRACIYSTVEADGLAPIFNPGWRIDGLFNFHSNINGAVTFLDRDVMSHLSHNPGDPEFCYRRVLTEEEEIQLQPRYSHAHLRGRRIH